MTDTEPMIIVVRKPDAKINKNRPINLLLQAQVRHLLEVEHRQLPPFQRTGETKDLSPMSQQQMDEYLSSWTEGQAANYIAKMTAKLHELNAKKERTRKTKPSVKKKKRARKTNPGVKNKPGVKKKKKSMRKTKQKVKARPSS